MEDTDIRFALAVGFDIYRGEQNITKYIEWSDFGNCYSFNSSVLNFSKNKQIPWHCPDLNVLKETKLFKLCIE